jgi:hypothetical protein
MEEYQWKPPIKKVGARRIVPIVLVIVLIVVAVVIAIHVKGGFAPGPTPTPTPTPTTCEIARDSIQAALDDYYAEYGEWPTADGQSGDIDWDKLVPSFMGRKPSNDANCDWQVNSNPEGKVCIPKTC